MSRMGVPCPEGLERSYHRNSAKRHQVIQSVTRGIIEKTFDKEVEFTVKDEGVGLKMSAGNIEEIIVKYKNKEYISIDNNILSIKIATLYENG